MRRKLALVLACAMMALCFAACGGTAAPSPSQIPGATAPANVEEGLLRMAFLADFQTMDLAQTTNDYFIPMNVFDRLFEIEVAENGSTSIAGSLCADYTLSEDGLTYTFQLRDGVTFSNGAALTAEDVLYSFSRLLTAGGVNDDIPLEIAGAEALQSGEADVLAGFAIIDDLNFTITLASPNAGFIAELTAPAVSIIDKDTTEAAQNYGIDVNETIGSGPYVITEWATNDHFTLVANESYWGEAPSVRTCIVSIIPDASTQNLMFQNGELDVIDLDWLDSVIVSSTYEVKYADQITARARVALTYFAMNANDEYLSDVNVRKAVQMAINRQSIVDGLYNGYATVLNGIIPKGVVGFNENGTEITYDPEGAKALLKDAGYEEGEVKMEIALDSSSNPNVQLACQIIEQDLEKAGIDAEIVSYDESSWLATRKAGEMCSFIATWTMDYNDPANIMYTFFGNTEKTVIRSLNYADTAVMDRVSAASSIVDDATRYTEYQALEHTIVIDDAAWVPMYSTDHLFCTGDRVANFVPHWAGYSDFSLMGMTLK